MPRGVAESPDQSIEAIHCGHQRDADAAQWGARYYHGGVQALAVRIMRFDRTRQLDRGSNF